MSRSLIAGHARRQVLVGRAQYAVGPLKPIIAVRSIAKLTALRMFGSAKSGRSVFSGMYETHGAGCENHCWSPRPAAGLSGP